MLNVTNILTTKERMAVFVATRYDPATNSSYFYCVTWDFHFWDNLGVFDVRMAGPVSTIGGFRFELKC
jgi:hypothetical protein